MSNLTNPELDGVVHINDAGRAVVTFERQLAHPVERVWSSLTDSAHAWDWLGDLELEPRVGGKVVLCIGAKTNTGEEVNRGEVTAWEPPGLLEYWINDSGKPGDHHVLRFELRETAEGCALTFSNTFGKGERARNSVVCGWHRCVECLVEALEGRPTDFSQTEKNRERIVELYVHYRNDKPKPPEPRP